MLWRESVVPAFLMFVPSEEVVSDLIVYNNLATTIKYVYTYIYLSIKSIAVFKWILMSQELLVI